jgi:hypothetical protein
LPTQNNNNNTDDVEELMEQSVKTATSSTSIKDQKYRKAEWSPPTSIFHRFQVF